MSCRTNLFIIYDLHSLLESNQKIQKEKEASNGQQKTKYKIVINWKDINSKHNKDTES